MKDISGTLHFSNVTAEDKGRYMCVATNSQGIINATIDIDVIGVCLSSYVFLTSISQHLSKILFTCHVAPGFHSY